MFDFYQKRKFKVVLGSHYVQAIVLVATIFVMVSAYTRYQIAVEMEDRRELMEQEAEALEERKNALETEVNYLSDERGIEAEMRRQFDVAKEGETVVVIVEDEEEEVETYIEPESTKERRWYEFWH